MNKATNRVTGNYTDQPQNQKNYEDCPEHVLSLLIFRTNYLAYLANFVERLIR